MHARHLFYYYGMQYESEQPYSQRHTYNFAFIDLVIVLNPKNNSCFVLFI